jgi:L-alanine-DL-glutamate epimerase-like enolase superfamily enzyme
LDANLLKEGPEISNGYAKLTAKPGLGILLDEEVLKEYKVKEFPRK